MNKRYESQVLSLIALVSCLLATVPGPVHADGGFAKVGTFGAQFEKLVRSPRSEALGGADMATASGSFATLANTSPLPEGNWIGASYGGFYYLSDTKIDYLGSAFENGPWRLSAVGARAEMDDMLVRTAYNPEGTGETFDAGSKFIQLNTSYDLSRLVFPTTPQLQWTVGLGYRHHFFDLAETSTDAGSFDLGTSTRLTLPLESGWLQFSGSAHFRNFTDATYVFDLREASLPQIREFGLAANIIQDLTDREGNELQFLILYSTSKDLSYDSGGFFGHTRIGFELTLLEILALRSGSDSSRELMDEMSYGFGLILPRKWTGSFLASYDYAYLENEGFIDSITEDSHLHALNLRFLF